MIVYDLKDDYPIRSLCSYLKVSTSGYYRWVKLGKTIHYKLDETIANLIEPLFHETYKGYTHSVIMQIPIGKHALRFSTSSLV